MSVVAVGSALAASAAAADEYADVYAGSALGVSPAAPDEYADEYADV